MRNIVLAVLLSFAVVFSAVGVGTARMGQGKMMGPGSAQKGTASESTPQQPPCMRMGRGGMGMGMMGMGMQGMMGPRMGMMRLHMVFRKAMKVATAEERKALMKLEKEVASKGALYMVEMMQQRDLWKECMMKEGCSSQNTQKHYDLMLQARDRMAQLRMKTLAQMEKIIGKEKMKQVLGSGMMGMGQN